MIYSKIEITGCDIVPIPLFHVLDGRTSTDYIARVEPSSDGGRKMAEYILESIEMMEKGRLYQPSSPGYMSMRDRE
jgi:hypothetical protein